jgi:hypothetical protein
MVVSQAALTPISIVPAATPAISSIVVTMYPGSTVSQRCGQIFSVGKNASPKTVRIGNATMVAMAPAPTVQGSIRNLRNARVFVSIVEACNRDMREFFQACTAPSILSS